MAGSFPVLPHPVPCLLRRHRGQPGRSPTPGSLGIGEQAAGLGHRAPQDAGGHWQRDAGWSSPSLPSSRGEGGHTRGLQAVSGVKANCLSSCQPQKERHEHHLSAGADSVGDCSGLPRRFKMEMA